MKRFDVAHLPTFDAARLNRATTDEAIQARMVAAFLRQLPSVMDGIRASARSTNPDGSWREAVHKLHGGCLSIGAARAAELLSHMENDDRFSEPGLRLESLAVLEAEMTALTEVLDRKQAGKFA